MIAWSTAWNAISGRSFVWRHDVAFYFDETTIMNAVFSFAFMIWI